MTPIGDPNFFFGDPQGLIGDPQNRVFGDPKVLIGDPQNPIIGDPRRWLVTPKNWKNQKVKFRLNFFRLWLGLKNIFKMCIFDFQYQIIDLIRVSSIFWFFYKMWYRPIFMARFMWSKTACICIEIRLESKNKCWDLNWTVIYWV